MQLSEVHRAHFNPFAGRAHEPKRADQAELVRQLMGYFMETQRQRVKLLCSVAGIAIVSADFGRSFA